MAATPQAEMTFFFADCGSAVSEIGALIFS
jgi:hypothetical protein